MEILWPYDTTIWFRVRRSQKRWKFEKWSQKCGSNILTNLNFWGKTFSQRTRWNFLWALRTSSRNLEGPRNLNLCVIKKNRDRTAHLSKKYFQKLRKKLSFSLLSLTKCYTFCNFFKNRWLKVHFQVNWNLQLKMESVE